MSSVVQVAPVFSSHPLVFIQFFPCFRNPGQHLVISRACVTCFTNLPSRGQHARISPRKKPSTPDFYRDIQWRCVFDRDGLVLRQGMSLLHEKLSIMAYKKLYANFMNAISHRNLLYIEIDIMAKGVHNKKISINIFIFFTEREDKNMENPI